MTATEEAGGVRVRVRPKSSLLSNAFASIILGTTPFFGVAYWFASSRGGIEIAVIAHVCVVALGLLLLWRQLSVFCAVTADELIGNGIFTPLVRVPLTEVRRVLLVPTYLGAAPDPVLQLLVLGDGGARLFRMRGTFWHVADLKALAAQLPVPIEHVHEALSLRDFFRAYPGAAYWFEHRRPLRVAIVTVAVLIGLAAAIWIMGLLGLPVRIF